MAERRALYRDPDTGQVQEVADGDTIVGSASGQTTLLKIDGGAAATTFPDYLLRLDFGRNGATINPSGTP